MIRRLDRRVGLEASILYPIAGSFSPITRHALRDVSASPQSSPFALHTRRQIFLAISHGKAQLAELRLCYLSAVCERGRSRCHTQLPDVECICRAKV